MGCPQHRLICFSLNYQSTPSVAWQPVPHAVAMDAFSIPWESNFYSFPHSPSWVASLWKSNWNRRRGYLWHHCGLHSIGFPNLPEWSLIVHFYSPGLRTRWSFPRWMSPTPYLACSCQLFSCQEIPRKQADFGRCYWPHIVLMAAVHPPTAWTLHQMLDCVSWCTEHRSTESIVTACGGCARHTALLGRSWL